ncbi:CTP synthase [Aphelenchoides fujianensis]|nr:CTP synthase [Aphelenchoides fujianensis]
MATAAVEEVKLLLVTGSVISGLGEGVIAASLGVLLRAHGHRVSALKLEPYLNADARTFSPLEHGEVFVLDDGAQVDAACGDFERLLALRLRQDNSLTGGKVLQQVPAVFSRLQSIDFRRVLAKERAGAFRGQTVQFEPHVSAEIVAWMERVAAEPVDGTTERPAVCIVELGGTVDDADGRKFLKAFGAHFRPPQHDGRLLHVHVSVLLGTAAEPEKTKPIQRGVDAIRRFGLAPDLLLVRCERPLGDEMREKLAGFAQLEREHVIDVPNVASPLRVPLLLDEAGVLESIREKLKLEAARPFSADFCSLAEWKKLVDWRVLCSSFSSRISSTERPKQEVSIAVVGTHASHPGAHKSVSEALEHAAAFCDRRVRVRWLEADDLVLDNRENAEAWKTLRGCDGVLVADGNDERRVEGAIAACRFARTHDVPFLGVSLGMRAAVVEFARNVAAIEGANSAEPVVIDGGALRVGRRSTVFLAADSVLRRLYAKLQQTDAVVEERHRRRFEVNPLVVPLLSANGLRFVGVDEPRASNRPNQAEHSALRTRGSDEPPVRAEIAELSGHRFFVGVQFRPEFRSSPLRPSPPFVGLLLAATGQLVPFLDGRFTSKIAAIRAHSVETGDEKVRSDVRPLGAQPEYNS